MVGHKTVDTTRIMAFLVLDLEPLIADGTPDVLDLAVFRLGLPTLVIVLRSEMLSTAGAPDAFLLHGIFLDRTKQNPTAPHRGADYRTRP